VLFGDIVIKHVVCNIVMNYRNLLPIDAIVVWRQGRNYMTPSFLVTKELANFIKKTMILWPFS